MVAYISFELKLIMPIGQDSVHGNKSYDSSTDKIKEVLRFGLTRKICILGKDWLQVDSTGELLEVVGKLRALFPISLPLSGLSLHFWRLKPVALLLLIVLAAFATIVTTYKRGN